MYIYTCIYVYMYICIYVVYLFICSFIYSFARTHTHVYIYTHTYIHTYKHTYIHAYIHIKLGDLPKHLFRRKFAHAHMQRSIHIQSFICYVYLICSYNHSNNHSYNDIYNHSYTYTYTYTYNHSCSCISPGAGSHGQSLKCPDGVQIRRGCAVGSVMACDQLGREISSQSLCKWIEK